MNIHELLSTKERVKILKHVVYKTESLSVNKTANELKLSKGLISKFFEILVKEKIMKRKKTKFFIQENLNTKTIKIFLNLGSFNTKIFAKHKFITSAGIYGSYVKGTNTEESDIDLWILVKGAKEEDLAKLTNELKRKYDCIRPLYLTKEKLKILKTKDSLFYHALIFGSIIICGEVLENV